MPDTTAHGDETVAAQRLVYAGKKVLSTCLLKAGPHTIPTHKTMIRSLRSCFGLLAIATLSTSVASGQESQLPVSRTVGVIDVSLPVNQTTLMAIPLAEIVASGTVTAVAGTTYTLSSSPTTLPNVLTTPHAIKITSRVDQRGTGANAPSGSSTNAYGLSAQITAQSGQDVTAALGTAPNIGDEFIVYQLETIGSIFGVENTAGLRSGSLVSSSDVIYVDNGAGALVGYFYRSSSSNWVLLSNPASADQSGVVIPVGRGIMVARKSGGNPVSLRFTGDTMIGKETIDVVNSSFNCVNNFFTVSTTLAASGLRNFIQGGSLSSSADIVYLESAGVLTGYFYRTSVSQWRLVSNPNSADQGAAVIEAGKAILFSKKATATEFTLQEPFAE